jgi:TatD DNase family protein
MTDASPETIDLIDSHAHIYGPDYLDDLESVLQRAHEAGVSTVIIPGADLASSREAVTVATGREGLFAAVGVHPHDAAEVDDDVVEAIRNLAIENPSKVVAIGEVGLDFYRDRSPRPLQEVVFRRFISLARQLSLPLIVHDRDAHGEIMTILAEEKAHEVGGVLHCFSGDLEMARACRDLNFLISIPGTVTYPGNTQLHEVVRQFPVESLLIETDAPYLTPVPFRGKRNEPAHVRLVAQQIAALKGLSLEDVARITSRNARQLFNLPGQVDTPRLSYRIRNSLYLNITNRCSNRCTFCPKFDDFVVKGHDLLLNREPTAQELLDAVGDPGRFDEIVFCGYGEPLIRLEVVKEVAKALKNRGARIRINTDGQANLVHGRSITPELAGLVDEISISLNAADPDTYQRLCNTPFGPRGFAAVCAFISESTSHIPRVVATAVALPGLDMEPIRRLAISLGAIYRERPYAEVG